MVAFITKRLLLIVQCFVRVFRKALCCFKRARRNSGEPAQLTDIGIVCDGEAVESLGWGDWDQQSAQPLNPVEEQIRLYRQQRAQLQQTKDDDDQPLDFFVDMTPRIVKQKKVLLSDDNAESQKNNAFNLSFAPEAVYNTPELGVWEENQSWEAQADGDLDVSDVLREQKRLERERRLIEQQRKKLDRSRQVVATKMS